MALIKSTILAQISGSINGMTFSHNSGGAYARNRSVPANPGTDRQDTVRTAISSLSKAWSTLLTQAQREAWRAYGQVITVQNRLGDSIKLSGIAAFIRINQFRTAVLGREIVMDPPPVDNVSTIGAAPIFVQNGLINTAGVLTTQIAFNETLDGDYSFIAYYSGPISKGIKYYRGPYPIVTAPENPSTGTIVDFTLSNSAIEGQNGAVKLVCFEESSGLKVWEIYLDPMLVPEPEP